MVAKISIKMSVYSCGIEIYLLLFRNMYADLAALTKAKKTISYLLLPLSKKILKESNIDDISKITPTLWIHHTLLIMQCSIIDT